MPVLSERDIVKQLGKGIFIYPFKGVHESLSGCCLKLTASKFAYIVESTGEVLEDNISKKEAKPIIDPSGKDTFFLIPPGKTALVWTNESILLNGCFCGSIHSKVNISARGIGHIGTRVNPYWGGVLSIALHNLSNNEEVKIRVGEPIAYMRFHELKSKSLEEQTDAAAKQRASAKLADAFPPECAVPQELKDWISEKGWREGIKDSLKKELEESKKNEKDLNEYQKAQRNYSPISLVFSPYKEIPWQIIFFAINTVLTVTNIVIFKMLKF